VPSVLCLVLSVLSVMVMMALRQRVRPGPPL